MVLVQFAHTNTRASSTVLPKQGVGAILSSVAVDKRWGQLSYSSDLKKDPLTYHRPGGAWAELLSLVRITIWYMRERSGLLHSVSQGKFTHASVNNRVSSTLLPRQAAGLTFPSSKAHTHTFTHSSYILIYYVFIVVIETLHLYVSRLMLLSIMLSYL